MKIATFRLLTASLIQAMRSNDYVATIVSPWSAVIGVFRSSTVPLFRQEVDASSFTKQSGRGGRVEVQKRSYV